MPLNVLEDPRSLGFTCQINGEVAQTGDFAGMSKSPEDLISWLSAKMPLAQGDVVALGTPKGVTTVKPGDDLQITIDALGSLDHHIVQEDAL